MSEYVIESGVPIRPRHATKYPWPQMGHGQSVWVPVGGPGQPSRPGVVTVAIGWLRRNRPGWNARSRTEGDGVRIWLINPDEETP